MNDVFLLRRKTPENKRDDFNQIMIKYIDSREIFYLRNKLSTFQIKCNRKKQHLIHFLLMCGVEK